MKRWFILAILMISGMAGAQVSVPGWPSTGGGSSSGSGTGSSTAQPSFLVTASPYNAKCDGVTDDTTAIQAAENAAEAAGGGTVIFPLAQCNYSSTLTIQHSNINWLGQGDSLGGPGTLLMDTAAGNDFLDLSGTINFGSIKNIIFRRNLAFTGSPNGISLNNVKYWDIDHVDVWDSANAINMIAGNNNRIKQSRIVGFASTITNGILMNVSNSTYITDVDFINGGHNITNAINLTGSVADLWVERINVASGGGVVLITGNAGSPSGQDVHLVSPILECGSAGACLQITSTNGNNCGLSTPCQVTVVDPHISNSAGPGIVLTNAQGVNIVGGEIRCQVANNCVQITGASSTNDTLNGNWFRSSFGGASPTSFLQISSAGKNISIVNNQFFGTSSFPFGTAIAVTGTTNGIYSNNSISGNGTTGISLDSTSTGNQLIGNIIDPTAITTQISDLSGGSVSGSSSNSGLPFFLDPSKYIFFWDDFTSGAQAITNLTPFITGGMNMTWVFSNSGAGPTVSIITPADGGTIGAVKLSVDNVSGHFAQLFASAFVNGGSITQTSWTTLNNTTFDIKFRAKISATTSITWKMGFTDSGGTNEIGFAYDTGASDAIWKGVCNNAGTATRSSIAGSTLDTNYHDFRMRSTVSGTVLFSIDGGTEVSINTNLPTVNMVPRITLTTNTTTAISTSIDYIWGWIAITR